MDDLESIGGQLMTLLGSMPHSRLARYQYWLQAQRQQSISWFVSIGCPPHKAELIIQYCISLGQRSPAAGAWLTYINECKSSFMSGLSAAEVLNWISDLVINPDVIYYDTPPAASDADRDQGGA